MKKRLCHSRKAPVGKICVNFLMGLLLGALMPNTDVSAFSIKGYTYRIRGDSILHSDGSIERIVVQPKNFTPETAQTSQAWEQSDSAKGGTYFKAKGRFESPDRMPRYYEYYGELNEQVAEARSKAVASTLEHRYTRIDYVFATEHRWQEELKHGPRLEEMVTAFHEAVEWNLSLQKGALQAVLRPEYDASPYLEWYREVLVPVAEELYLLQLELNVRARRHEEGPGAIERAWNEKLRNARDRILNGISVDAWKEGDWGSAEWIGLLYDFYTLGTNYDGTNKILTALMTAAPGRFFRRVDGQPLGLVTLDSLWKVEADTARKQFINTNYADAKKLSRIQENAARRVLGPYWCTGLCLAYDFLFTISMPGYIVDTNGEVKAENKVAWSFDHSDVYPFGFEMYARSLEPDLETQQATTGGQPLRTRRALLEFVDIVATDADLKQSIEKSGKDRRVSPELTFRLGEQYRLRNSPDLWFWYCQAAAAGHERTLYYLASWYAFDTIFSRIGLEIPATITPDDRAAYVWYAIAEANGYTWAADDHDLLAEKLNPQAREQAEQMLKTWTPEQCPWPGSGNDAAVAITR